MPLTRAQYLDHVCAKVGQQDASSRSVCSLFIDNRYKMIWDKRDWKDSKTYITGLTIPTTGIMTFPAGIERIIAIRSTGNHFMSPTTFETMMENDPTIFERLGDPWAFDEYTTTIAPAGGNVATAITRQIRVFPTPQVATAAIMEAKLSFTSLANDTDIPILRSIDESLLAYVHADMLQRQRQYEKAQMIMQQADTAFQIMVDAETVDSAFSARVIPLVENYEWDWWYDGQIFDLFSASGQTTSTVSESGSTPLVNGQANITVQFTIQKPSSAWHLTEETVVNTVDANPLNIYITMLTAKSPTGFTAQLNAQPNSANYTLNWTASV